MSTHGHHAGGIVGFLNGVKMLSELVSPRQIIVCWEGGGSSRRKAIFPDYKKNRKPPKLNRYYEDEIPDSAENRVQQIKALVEMLNLTPVIQVYVDNCEADDVIGYLCKNKFREEKKIIASSDKDFYQLLDENTLIYSWTKSQFISQADVLKEYNITSINFATAKCFCGDSSDNIPGVKGLGFKTLAKRFPELGLEKDISVYDIIESAEKQADSKLKVMKNIVSSVDMIKRNWRLMYLDVTNIAAQQVMRIEAQIDNHEPKRRKLDLMRRLRDEGLPTFDVHDFWDSLQIL